jgi:hypothetical protein
MSGFFFSKSIRLKFRDLRLLFSVYQKKLGILKLNKFLEKRASSSMTMYNIILLPAIDILQ